VARGTVDIIDDEMLAASLKYGTLSGGRSSGHTNVIRPDTVPRGGGGMTKRVRSDTPLCQIRARAHDPESGGQRATEIPKWF
jgi:hypothetical protein